MPPIASVRCAPIRSARRDNNRFFGRDHGRVLFLGDRFWRPCPERVICRSRQFLFFS
jgi:hypothetical protein